MKIKKTILSLVIAASSSLTTFAQPDPFADRVPAYQAGTDFATDFATGLGYTNTIAALGAPSAVTPGDFGGPVTPFSPPYLGEQLLSIGEGGMAIFEFDPPIFNHPGNPFGLDFIIYGSAGFSITNGNFSGGGITDGTLFGQNTGSTRVSVSSDNETYYPLNPAAAPIVDHYFPSDGSGRAGIPVAPEHSSEDFAGADLNGIRALYRHGAGGTGYDLAWAQSEDGTPPELTEIRFVRVEVISGRSEIDALAATQPTESHGSQLVTETFDSDPLQNGWEPLGDASLFSWDAEAQRLIAQWDSSRPNSYFAHPLGKTIDVTEDFTIAFDLTFESIEIGTTENKAFTFPIAIGLVNLAQATRTDYFRGTGIDSVHGPKGVVEWNYLPDSGFGATVSSGLISQDNQWAFQNSFPLELSTGTDYHVRMQYDAEAGILATTMTANGIPFGPIMDASLDDIFGNPLEGGFTSLEVDTFAISSYSDEGQSPPEFAGSIQARGFLDNISVSADSAPSIAGIQVTDSEIVLEFEAFVGQRYWLEQSTDLTNWMTLQHQSPSETGTAQWRIEKAGPIGFFRLRAESL